MNASVKTQIVTETETNNIKAQIKEDVMNEAKSIQITTEAPNTNPQIINVPMEMLSVPVSHPRRNSGDMETLQKSISQNGLLEPLTVCKSDEGDFYMVIDGTRRLTALLEFGWKTVPCIILNSMPLGEIAHFAYEKNMERRSLSPIEIALHLKSMREKYGYSLRDLEALGYGSPALISQKIKLLNLPVKVKKMIEKAEITTAHGVALCKLANKQQQEKMAKRAHDSGWPAKRLGIAIEKLVEKSKSAPKEKVSIPEGEIPGVYFKDAKDMSELPDKSVHLIVTSPPYSVGMEYEKGISYDEHWENMQAVMAESARVLVPGGVLALNVADIHNYKGPDGKAKKSQIQLVGHKYQSFLRRHQIYLSDIIIWVKRTYAVSLDVSKAWSDKTPHTGYRILISHEPVYIFRKAGEREVPSEDVALSSGITRQEWDKWITGVWTINTVNKNDGHPAVYPDELAYRLIKMFSYEGDRVLDPFLGSGTTIKVARELGREAIGYEREIQYKTVIMQKLGLTEETIQPDTMLGYYKKTMDLEALEQESIKAEAEAASKLFGMEAEVFETGEV
jgi:ParB/RepB/Spo0J family partition protein